MMRSFGINSTMVFSWIILALFHFPISGAHAGPVNFAPPVNFAVGTYPDSVAVGDLNGDGKPDLAVANLLSRTISILLGDGTGAFGPATDFAVSGDPRSVAIGDFNGDGKLDLAVVNESSNAVSIFLGDGTGAFGPATDFAVGARPLSVAVGDFNRDGKLDVVTANVHGFSISILLGDGTGAFGLATDFVAGDFPESLAVGDFNGDGKLDLAVARGRAHSVSILLGDGTGAFGPATSFAVGGLNPLGVAVGDLNGDGKLDLAVTNAGSNALSVLLNTTAIEGAALSVTKTATPTVHVGDPISVTAHVMNTGDTALNMIVTDDKAGPLSGPAILAPGDEADYTGSYPAPASGSTSTNTVTATGADRPGTGDFGSPARFSTDGDAVWVAIADFNRDGKLDLAAVNEHETPGPAISILLGDGLGSFGTPTHFPAGGGPENLYVTIGDFDRDGKQDLAVARYYGSIRILRGDGTGGFEPPVDFDVGGRANSVAVGDLNGDGKLDLVTAIGEAAVSVRVNTTTFGSLSFAPPAYFDVGSGSLAVAVGDFNRDGKLDVATNYGMILLGDGSGALGTPTFFAVQAGPKYLAVGDFNQDGALDLAVPNYHSNSVSILLGDGLGSFGAATNFPAGTGPNGLAVGDFNRDGKLDLVMTNTPQFAVASILLGDGAGGFGAPTAIEVGFAGQIGIAVADLNEDGKLDLAVAGQGGGVSVLLGRRVVTASASFTTTILNDPPVVGTLASVPAAVGDSVLIATGGSIAFSAPWTDVNLLDTHTACVTSSTSSARLRLLRWRAARLGQEAGRRPVTLLSPTLASSA